MTARVSRKMKENVKVSTVYGTQTIEKCRCHTCKQLKTVNDFYLDYRTGKIRNQCVECWDLYKGRSKSKYNPTNTLYDVMENTNDRLPMGGKVQTKNSTRSNPATKFKRDLL